MNNLSNATHTPFLSSVMKICACRLPLPASEVGRGGNQSVQSHHLVCISGSKISHGFG